ncbi:MAG: 4-(cytidine 5'-diphospho)-2-C-methyl-D-erythritol kinase [Rhizobiaceae bacterium]
MTDAGRTAAITASAMAPAKINLALHVTGLDDKAFHLLDTLVVFADFGDRITIARADRDGFEVTGLHAGALAGEGENLVTQARDMLRQSHRRHDCFPVAIALEKNLPVASGVGGGSSDAATTLRLLARIWNLPAGEGELARIGLALGADVPMCLAGRPLVARGIGEAVTPIPAFPALSMVLVNPGIAVPTGAVFSALAGKQNPPLPPLPVAPTQGQLIDWLATTRNDLEAPAKTIAPAIDEAGDLLAGTGALLARMSGSGATCFGLFGDRLAAETAAGAIAKRRPRWFVRAVTTGGSPAS